MINKVMSFLKEYSRWIAAGRPTRSKEKMLDIYMQCASNECGSFKKDKCQICGCYLHPSRESINKIYMATTSCPHENEYWSAEHEGEEPTKRQLLQAQIEIRDGKDCGC